jgi:hypothetical protein
VLLAGVQAPRAHWQVSALVADGIFLRAKIVFDEEPGPLVGGCQMTPPRKFCGEMVVATGEMHRTLMPWTPTSSAASTASASLLTKPVSREGAEHRLAEEAVEEAPLSPFVGVTTLTLVMGD